MRTEWQRIISAQMEAVEIPGREMPLYVPRGEQASVWILTEIGEWPLTPPPIDPRSAALNGGKDLQLDASDPDFLLVHKVVGISECTHCIPWSKIVDIIFHSLSL
jgi:hypothetical protein